LAIGWEHVIVDPNTQPRFLYSLIEPCHVLTRATMPHVIDALAAPIVSPEARELILARLEVMR